eukprot:7378660-Prymnesium_polylepis.2
MQRCEALRAAHRLRVVSTHVLCSAPSLALYPRLLLELDLGALASGLQLLSRLSQLHRLRKSLLVGRISCLEWSCRAGTHHGRLPFCCLGCRPPKLRAVLLPRESLCLHSGA